MPSHKSSSGSINDLDPVIVKRRVAGQTPALSDVIDWKQSFFLNLICQLPCTLTVSICSKSDESGMTRAASDMMDPSVMSGSQHDLPIPRPKPTMSALRRITKKVYASPYKSRMDVKDASMNECSYPLVYYSINDYESDTLHLSIAAGEYLCTELSVTIPSVHSSAAYIKASSLIAEITVEQDSEPFPLPPDYTKVILFQGAVSFKALADVYQQKGIAAANQMRSGWGRKNSNVEVSSRIEYVLMRGPHGKGQCQGTIWFNDSCHSANQSYIFTSATYQRVGIF